MTDLRLEYIYDTFGREHQLKKLAEEAKELADAVDGFIAGKDTAGHIAEELADVQLVAEQLIAHGIINRPSIARIKARKIRRTLSRIKSGYYSKNRED